MTFEEMRKAGLFPVALAGRTPVKVSLESGQINTGDYLTTSTENNGYCMKATKSSRVIGTALESFDGNKGEKGKIMAFINLHYWINSDEYKQLFDRVAHLEQKLLQLNME